MFVLHVVVLDSILGLPYDPQNLLGVILECRNRSNPCAHQDVVQKQKENIFSPWLFYFMHHKNILIQMLDAKMDPSAGEGITVFSGHTQWCSGSTLGSVLGGGGHWGSSSNHAQ